MPDVDAVAERLIAPELLPGETVLWCARPARDVLEERGITPARAGLPREVMGVVVSIVVVVLFAVAPAPVALGMSAALAAIGALAFGAWVERRRARAASEIAYAVTNRRILIRHGDGSTSWISGREIASVETGGRSDGTGELTFSRAATNLERLEALAYEERGDRLVPEEKLTVEETFASVRDAAAVRKLVIETFGLKRDA